MSKHAKSDRNADSRDENGKNAANNIFKEENPFHSLDVSRFPKKKTVAEREPRVSKKQFRLADNVARDEDSFAELMLLSGVESLPPKGVVSDFSIFCVRYCTGQGYLRRLSPYGNLPRQLNFPPLRKFD